MMAVRTFLMLLSTAALVAACSEVPSDKSAPAAPGRLPVATSAGPPPGGAVLLAKVEGTSCQRNAWDPEPTSELAITEMKIKATSAGADGVYNMWCRTEVPNPMTVCWGGIRCGGDAVRMAP